ncbi:MAG: N-6 DNA methylase [Lachnospiraceae bacterium]
MELDIFGEIYEYFLGEFALAEGQGGGEFYKLYLLPIM